MLVSTIDIDFVRAQGVKSSGRIMFQPARMRIDTTMLSAYPVRVDVTDGKGSVDLVRLPAGTYHVHEMIDEQSAFEFYFTLPLSAPATIQYEDIAAVSAVPLFYTMVRTINHVAPDPVTGNIDVAGGGGSVPDATSSVKGILRLAGDLGGTATNPTVPALGDKYVKPGGGIPLTDFSAAVQALLAKANTAIQSVDLAPYATTVAVNSALAGKETVGAAAALAATLAPVATAGTYASLTARPTIPDSPDDIGAQPAGDYATNATTTALSNRLTIVENFSLVCPFLAGEYGMYSATGPDPLQFLATSSWNNNDHGFSAQYVPAGKPIVKVAVGVRAAGTYSSTGTPAQVKVYDLTGAKIGQSPDDATMFLAKGWSLQTLAVSVAPQSSGRWVFVGVSGGGFSGHSLAWPSAVSDWPEGAAIGLATGLRRAFYAGSGAGLPDSFNPATHGTSTSYIPLLGLIG